MKLLIFYASFLYFPGFALFLYIAFRRSGWLRMFAVLMILGTSILAYARFLEPRILTVEQVTLELGNDVNTEYSARIALFSDTHFGIFRNAMPMSRIVRRVNAEAPDIVLIAGDFLYHIEPEKIPSALAPLADLTAPAYAVMGNHDIGFPGPVYTDDLYAALQSLGVTLVENRALGVSANGHEFLIGGTSDLWQRNQDFGFTVDLPDKPLLLLTHNPDMAFHVPDTVNYDLMLAGHTHGGQIRLPGLYQDAIPTQNPFDKGLHRIQTKGRERLVYVTSGTGMVGLPMRFNMPPRIDMLTIYFPERD